MSGTKREAWGSLRKLPSGRWQARYPAPDGEMYPARTEDDKALTFVTKTDARKWLASMHSKISLGLWEPPEVIAERRRAETAAEQSRSMGFEEYSKRWLQMIKTEPNRSGKIRAVGTVRSYQGKVSGYLVPEFGDTPMRDIDIDRIRVMTDRLDRIPAPLNPRSKFNGITRPVLIVLMMILRQAARDGIIPSAPSVSIPRQESVRHDADHDESEDIITPKQVEALYQAVPDQWAIMVQLAAWCQLRRGECLGLQRRDAEWHDDGSATLHVRRQLNANTGDYTDLKSEAGKRSLSIPKLMTDRLKQHLKDHVATEDKAPLIPASIRGSMPLSNTRWGYIWADVRDSVDGLPHRFRFHDLRHTGLTIFAQEGATLAELMRRGGHADIHIVLRYQHATTNTETLWSERTVAPADPHGGGTWGTRRVVCRRESQVAEPARASRDRQDLASAAHVDDDVPLMRRLRDGDDTALSELHDRHVRAVYLLARSKVDSASDAEEVTQDAFLLLWRKCRRIDLTGTSCLPWLLTTANYLALNVQRASRRLTQRVTTALSADDLTSPREVDAEAARNMELEQVGRIVAALPQIDQDVFRLCVVEGLSYKQAAYQLRTSHSAVRNRLSRVRGALRKQIDQ